MAENDFKGVKTMSKSENHLNKDDSSVDSQTEVEKRRRQIFQSMTVEEKLGVAANLYFSALQLKQAQLKRLHPDWPEAKTKQKAKEWMLYARS